MSVSKQQVNGVREHLQDCSKAIGRYAKGVSKHKVNAQELRHQHAIGRSKVLASLVSTAWEGKRQVHGIVKQVSGRSSVSERRDRQVHSIGR